jgi:hypothetical protein
VVELLGRTPIWSSLARAIPWTTGLTASRWLGLEDSSTSIVAPLGDSWTPLLPRWYFTSPEPWVESGRCLPSNSLKILFLLLWRMFASTLSRPRWAMPMTACPIPASAAASSSAPSIAIVDSAPSSEKRLWPRYFVWRNARRPPPS